jgi:4-diphosphocytidyl-2-C-methyl-D-erythritol kinase
LPGIAATLGADVPVCLARQSAIMQGIGEILMPAPKLPNFGIMLVNPGVPVATAAVFRTRKPNFSPAANPPPNFATTGDFISFLIRQTNDLEAPAISIAPQIGDVLNLLRRLPDCLLARMSGSGATCFAIFPTPAHATATAPLITAPNWWRWAGGLYEPAHTDI